MSAGYWPIDEAFPAVLTDEQLMRVLGIKRSKFYELRSAGVFDVLKCRQQLPGRGLTRYNGALVQRWIDGNGSAFLRRAS